MADVSDVPAYLAEKDYESTRDTHIEHRTGEIIHILLWVGGTSSAKRTLQEFRGLDSKPDLSKENAVLKAQNR